MKLIDVSGIGHSGKTAVTDLLREFSQVDAHPNSFEFNLIRLPDGLIDLYRNIVNGESFVKADIAIKRFGKLAEKLSDNYSRVLDCEFREITKRFADSLVLFKYYAPWYDDLYISGKQGYRDNLKIVLKKIGARNLGIVVSKIIGYKYGDVAKKDCVYIANQVEIKTKFREYLNQILNISTNKIVVTNNCLEPFDPMGGMFFFDNAYSVIVCRDPRDTYASVMYPDGIYTPPFELNSNIYSEKYLKDLKRSFLGVEDIDVFIARQKCYFENLTKSDNHRIIKLNFEDLVLRYEETIAALCDRLGFNPEDHLSKGLYFSPEISKRNVQIWKNIADDKNLLKIENQLSPYLYKNRKEIIFS